MTNRYSYDESNKTHLSSSKFDLNHDAVVKFTVYLQDGD